MKQRALMINCLACFFLFLNVSFGQDKNDTIRIKRYETDFAGTYFSNKLHDGKSSLSSENNNKLNYKPIDRVRTPLVDTSVINNNSSYGINRKRHKLELENEK